ncbi:hypothetical protein ONS95_000269 [Cadophora gregata]|uniref:uncharacterized protein n=1 Tax=Cadophora gregata TaxID=51156 RepID=UPI0026DC4AC0|nr:uncharacterized protein ONS95_000269 [Cadophora gregata]KAK0128294.1 hypothetical protein ONS95_000269 [Cadophora gregata]
MEQLPDLPSLNGSLDQKFDSCFKRPKTDHDFGGSKAKIQHQAQEQLEDPESNTASKRPVVVFGPFMTADENTIFHLPGPLPWDAQNVAKAGEESNPGSQNLTCPVDSMDMMSDLWATENSGLDSEPTQERCRILRITNPDLDQDEQHQQEDPSTNIGHTTENKNITQKKRSGECNDRRPEAGTPSSKSLREKYDRPITAYGGWDDTNEGDAPEPPCCQWCSDPTKSKLPEEPEFGLFMGDAGVFMVNVAVRELENDDDETAQADERERELINCRAFQYREGRNQRSGGEPSNFLDDGTADRTPYWGDRYPDPPSTQEAGPAQQEHSAQLSTPPQAQETQPVPPITVAHTLNAPQSQEVTSSRSETTTWPLSQGRRGISFGNTPSPRRNVELDPGPSDTARIPSAPTSTQKSEDLPAYRVGNSGCKEVSRFLISKSAREATEFGMRRPSVGDLEPGAEPTTANGLPVVGFGASDVVKTKPSRGSIMSQEVKPEDVVVESSGSENGDLVQLREMPEMMVTERPDRGSVRIMTRHEAGDVLHGMIRRDWRATEGEDNTPHVEHQEFVANTEDGAGQLDNEEVKFVEKCKRLFKFESWRKPRKDQED